MKNHGMNFTEWHKSNHNPLKGCSAIADAFTKEALQAAFEAGALHAESKRKDAIEARKREEKRNIFSEDEIDTVHALRNGSASIVVIGSDYNGKR